LIIDPHQDAAPGELSLEMLADAGIHTLTYLKEVASTNTFALERLAQQTPAGPWLVLAGSQTAGRGRGENRWWSEVGALTFTLVVDAEKFGLSQVFWPRLSMAVGLANCQLLERSPWNLPMQVKWPNDVYVRGRKLGGVLIEHLGSKLVIGIGLNVNQRFAGAPQEVRERATSLLMELGSECDSYALFVEVVKEVMAILPSVAQDEVDFSHEAGARSYLQWKKVMIRQGKTSTTGMCEGIDVDGALLLRTEAGILRVLSGTVEIAGK
jgi:BirA family biotin operon repressor/biotin-[acetyl-CoA-carboxylase] ligase